MLKSICPGGEINRIPTNDENIGSRPLIEYSQKMRDLASFQPISAISPNSQKLLKSPRKAVRKIPKSPFKVLDAPDLQDDFYLNLVDWSSTNVLSVLGLN